MNYTSEYIIDLQNKLQSVLSEKRFLHTLGVAYVSASLAMAHGLNQKEALIAGLLHDCAKHYSGTELQEKCKEAGLAVSEYEMQLTQLLHAPYGAYLAETQYQIDTKEILFAIRNHTVGRPAMTPLEQIVFLADYFEPERKQKTEPSLDEIRKIAFYDLEEATFLVLKNTLRYLESTGQEMAPETLETYRYYANRRVTETWKEQSKL